MSKASIDSVQAWLSLELEQRGIDAVIYTRHVLNLFLNSRYTTDHHLAKKEADIFAKLPPGTKSCKPKRKYKRRSSSCGAFDKIALKKEMAASCLLSASEETSDDFNKDKSIQTLIDDLCDKLSKLNLLSENGSSSDEGHVGKCTDKRRESYHDAFPSLMNLPPDSPTTTTENNCFSSVWNGQKIFGKKLEKIGTDSHKPDNKFKSSSENSTKTGKEDVQQLKKYGKSKKTAGQRNTNKQRPYPFFDSAKKSPSYYKRKNGLLGGRHTKERYDYDKENANELKAYTNRKVDRNKQKQGGGDKSLQLVSNMQNSCRSFLSNAGTFVPNDAKVYETSKFKGSSRFNHTSKWNEQKKTPSIEKEIAHLYSAGLSDIFENSNSESAFSSKWFLNPQSGCLEFQPASKFRSSSETTIEESWLYCPSPSLWEDDLDDFHVVGSQSRFESIYRPQMGEFHEDQFLAKIKHNYEAIFTDVLKKSSSFSKAPGTDPKDLDSEETDEENALPPKKEEPHDLTLLPSFENDDGSHLQSNTLDIFSEVGVFPGHYGNVETWHRVETRFEFTEDLWKFRSPDFLHAEKLEKSLWQYNSHTPEMCEGHAAVFDSDFPSIFTRDVSSFCTADLSLESFPEWCGVGDMINDLTSLSERTATSRYMGWFNGVAPDELAVLPKKSPLPSPPSHEVFCNDMNPLGLGCFYDNTNAPAPKQGSDSYRSNSFDLLEASSQPHSNVITTAPAVDSSVPAEAIVDSLFGGEVLHVANLLPDDYDDDTLTGLETLQSILDVVDSQDDKVFEDAINGVLNSTDFIAPAMNACSVPLGTVETHCNNQLNFDENLLDKPTQSRGKHDSTNSNISLLEDCITENEAWKNSVRIGNICESISGIRPVNVLYSEKQTEPDECIAVLQPSALTHFRPIPEYDLDITDSNTGTDSLDQTLSACPTKNFVKPEPIHGFSITSSPKKVAGTCEGCSLCDAKIRGLETEFNNLLHEASFSSDDHPACPTLKPCLPKLVDKSMQTTFEEHIRLLDRDIFTSFSAVRPPKANSR